MDTKVYDHIVAALKFASCELPHLIDAEYVCASATAEFSRRIAVRNNVNFSNPTETDILAVGLFVCVISGHLTHISEVDYEPVLMAAVGIVFANPDRPLELPNIPDGILHLILDFYEMNLANSRFPQIIGENFAKYLAAPTPSGLSSLFIIFEVINNHLKNVVK